VTQRDIIVLYQDSKSDIRVAFPKESLLPEDILFAATSGAGVDHIAVDLIRIPDDFSTVLGWRVDVKGKAIQLIREERAERGQAPNDASPDRR
jgi:hypothetical protein